MRHEAGILLVLRDGLVAGGAAGYAREGVAEGGEPCDVVETGVQTRLVGGIGLVDEGLEFVHDGRDLVRVGIVREAERLRKFQGLRPRDLLLFGDPGVVLGLERLREARKGFSAEHVGEEIAACEADVHLAVAKADIECVAFGRAAHDRDLPGDGGFPVEKVVHERNVCDMIYFDCHCLTPSCFLCLVYTQPVERLHGDEISSAFSAEEALEPLPRAGLLDLAGGVGEVVGLVRVERADRIDVQSHFLLN